MSGQVFSLLNVHSRPNVPFGKSWLVEIPGVNAQVKTREELIESLRLGAEDMLETKYDMPEVAQLETIEV